MAPPANPGGSVYRVGSNTTAEATSAASSGFAATGGQTASSTSASASRGWLHPDNDILGQGVCYTVKYVGCLEVLTSMKSLDFETRTLIAKECIVRVCEAAGLRSADKKRKIDRRLQRVLADKPMMEHAGANVSLRINASSLSLLDLETNQPVAMHAMPNISFASGGEQDTLDFVAYVGKDVRQTRACFVLECGGGLAQEVIATIGQAFELRFREIMRSPAASNCSTAAAAGAAAVTSSFVPAPTLDPDYYNDLPGKVPPAHQHSTSAVSHKTTVSTSNNNSGANGMPLSLTAAAACKKGFTKPSSNNHIANIGNNNDTVTNNNNNNNGNSSSDHDNDRSRMNSGKGGGENLIDLDNPDTSLDHPIKSSSHDYVNTNLDPFDMMPMSEVLPPPTPTPSRAQPHPLRQPLISTTTTQQQVTGGGDVASAVDSTTTSSTLPPPPDIVFSIEQQLLIEPWYHGVISRAESEALLERDGDFLVRESRAQRGQFVLTGLQAGQGRHLLLIDPNGVVRTKDRTFSSISHLIHFHQDNELPILSADSALLLVRPIVHNPTNGPTSIPRTAPTCQDGLFTGPALASNVHLGKP